MSSRGLRRVFSDFQRHPWLHFVSIATITAALVLVGAFLVFFRNLERVAEKTNPRITGTIYLQEGLSEDQIRRVRDQAFAQELVRQVVFKDRNSIVGEIQAFLGEKDKPLPGTDAFPDVLEIELAPEAKRESVESIQRQLALLDGVQDVDFSDGWLLQFHKVRRLGQWIALCLAVALIVGCGFIIANFMGIRHQARQKEIQVARMMGAHRGFILAPFVWEGLIEGVLGALVAVVVLFFSTFLFSQAMLAEWGSILGRRLAFLSWQQLLGVTCVGIAMALVGSVLVFFRYQEPNHS